MLGLATSLVVGVVAGFVGAIPPGPVGLSVLEHAGEKRFGKAARVGIGGATVDLAICAAVGLGAGPVLARAATPLVRCALSVAYALAGVVVLARELRSGSPRRAARPGSSAASYVQGLLRGALNPTLFMSWGLFIAFLVANHVLLPVPAHAVAFAIGVGTGVAGWFLLLARVVAGPRPEWTNAWLRRATLVGALTVLAAGGAGAVQAFGGGG